MCELDSSLASMYTLIAAAGEVHLESVGICSIIITIMWYRENYTEWTEQEIYSSINISELITRLQLALSAKRYPCCFDYIRPTK